MLQCIREAKKETQRSCRILHYLNTPRGALSNKALTEQAIQRHVLETAVVFLGWASFLLGALGRRLPNVTLSPVPYLKLTLLGALRQFECNTDSVSLAFIFRRVAVFATQRLIAFPLLAATFSIGFYAICLLAFTFFLALFLSFAFFLLSFFLLFLTFFLEGLLATFLFLFALSAGLVSIGLCKCRLVGMSQHHAFLLLVMEGQTIYVLRAVEVGWSGGLHETRSISWAGLPRKARASRTYQRCIRISFVDEHDAVLKVDLVTVVDLDGTTRQRLIVHQHHAAVLVQVLQIDLCTGE